MELEKLDRASLRTGIALVTIGFISLLFYACPLFSQPLPQRVRIAVLNLEVTYSLEPTLSMPLTDRLRQELFETGNFQVIERNMMEEILEEQGFQMSGCVSDACAVEAGQLLGVTRMVAGSIARIDDLYSLNLRMIDVETGEVLSVISEDYTTSVQQILTEGLQEAVTNLVNSQMVAFLPEPPKSDSAPTAAHTPALTQAQLDSLPERINGPIAGMDFVLIPEGEFVMGSPRSEDGHMPNEEPMRQVNVGPFYMMTTELTQNQYRRIMLGNPSEYLDEHTPVHNVSWIAIQEFLRRLNAEFPGHNYRLPTEAEWEYACRAGTTSPYYSGNTRGGLNRVAWRHSSSEGISIYHPQPVALKEPNDFGLYDMHGNVWEWVQDCYRPSYYDAPYDASAIVEEGNELRVIRGGGFESPFDGCRSATRRSLEKTGHRDDVGFRLVMDVPDPVEETHE